MNRLFKCIISLVLTVSLVTATFVFAFQSSAQDNVTGTDIPTVYVVGTGSTLVVNEADGSERKVYPLSVSDKFIENTVKENIDVFAKAVLTQKWAEFGEVLSEIFNELHSEIALDENGRPTNGSHVNWTWSRDTLNGAKVNGKYPTDRFTFSYDWRLDPYETADILHRYIEDILYVTGEEKVALVGRCLGSCITQAYMEKYDGEYVSDFIIYASAGKGATPCSKCFSGKVHVDADGAERYLYDMDFAEDDYINRLIHAFVTVFNDTYGLDLAAWAVNNAWPNICNDVVPKVVMASYGGFPSYWGMVAEEDYEEAKELIFKDDAEGKYDNFINMIDKYHYNVQVKAEELFAGYIADGIEIANITKYGFQSIPITADATIVSDGYCDVFQQSMGATLAKVNEPFPQSYIDEAKANGTDKYISPDGLIDASTCYLPDRTWFIKNLPHANFPKIVLRLVDSIVNNDGYTVFTEENYPQYLVYNKIDGVTSLEPQVPENMNTDAHYKTTFFDAVKEIFKIIFNLIITSIKGASAA